MKKFLMLAALAGFVAAPMAAAPAMAKDKSPEEMQKHVDEWFSSVDSDGNGTVSEAEFTADASKMFKEADANGDGQLSKDEKLAHKKKKWEEKKD